MLIHNAELDGCDGVDVRVRDGGIVAVGKLSPGIRETVVDAAGGLLIPGLHDHHMHLFAFAAARASVGCGPPQVNGESELIEALNSDDRSDWLRGMGYHDSVAGEIDRHWLDANGPKRPVRIQHRSGRLWILNSAAMSALSLNEPADGRLFDQDELLHGHTTPPDIAAASKALISFGVTGLTDMTPDNGWETAQQFQDLRKSGALLQHVTLAGRLETPIQIRKFHLHEHDLPPFDVYCNAIRASHSQGVPVAVHCVTEVELVFTLSALEECGTVEGDRIEHASVTPETLLDTIKKLGVTVVTQPNFVTERGDQYLEEVPASQHESLYRLNSFKDHNIPLAGGTDAPFGDANPWGAMAAAVSRTTNKGACLNPSECLTAEQALELFVGAPGEPARPRRIAPGQPADLCLLTRPWSGLKPNLAQSEVRATWVDGSLAYQSG